MKVLHITPHMGGGVGTVIRSWMERVQGHSILCLDYVNDKTIKHAKKFEYKISCSSDLPCNIDDYDIIIVHYWDNPLLQYILQRHIPPCRLVFWCHKNFPVPKEVLSFPDRYYNTSPAQGSAPHIWSTGNMDRFFDIKKVEHEGFNIGYVGWVDYRKLHGEFGYMCERILDELPDATITVVGEVKIPVPATLSPRLKFVGQVDDVAPYLATLDVFGYPLRPDHFGTCEQSLGEAMAAGVPPIVMNNMAERWIVEDGWSGIRVKDEDQYIFFMRILYKHREERDYFSLNAQRKAKNLYNIDRMVNQWNEVFESMMKEPKKERKPL